MNSQPYPDQIALPDKVLTQHFQVAEVSAELSNTSWFGQGTLPQTNLKPEQQAFRDVKFSLESAVLVPCRLG